MTFDFSEYIPHGMILAFASIAGWVFSDHVHRDDARFKDTVDSMKVISAKLDDAFTLQAANHAEILKILLEQRT